MDQESLKKKQGVEAESGLALLTIVCVIVWLCFGFNAAAALFLGGGATLMLYVFAVLPAYLRSLEQDREQTQSLAEPPKATLLFSEIPE